MLQVKRPRYDELKETLQLLLVFREEFSDIYPEADIGKVAVTMQHHFNAYVDQRLISTIGAISSEWWFSEKKFLAETWFYVLPKHRNFKIVRGLLNKMKDYAKNKKLVLQLPISSGKDSPALYKKLGFKHMGNIWRYE